MWLARLLIVALTIASIVTLNSFHPILTENISRPTAAEPESRNIKNLKSAKNIDFKPPFSELIKNKGQNWSIFENYQSEESFRKGYCNVKIVAHNPKNEISGDSKSSMFISISGSENEKPYFLIDLCGGKTTKWESFQIFKGDNKLNLQIAYIDKNGNIKKVINNSSINIVERHGYFYYSIPSHNSSYIEVKLEFSTGHYFINGLRFVGLKPL